MITKIVEKLTQTKLWVLVRNNKIIYRIYKNTFGRFVDKSRNNLKRRMNEEVLRNGMQIIEEIESTLDIEKVCYFACAGTLLGIVRAGKLIKWDDDIDFGVMMNDEFTWKQLEVCMSKIGFSLKFQFCFHGEITEQTYIRGVVLVDFFNHFNKANNMYSFGFYRKDGYAYKSFDQVHTALYKTIKISGSKKLITDDGTYVRIPNEAEEYLRDIYGETWRIPDPNYVANSGPSCTRLGDDELGMVEQKM